MSKQGLILKSNGGFFEVETENGVVTCRGRGAIRHENTRILVGDRVVLTGSEDAREGQIIDTVLPRTTRLERPPMANLTVLFLVVAAAKPAPITATIDRLLCVTADSGVKPALLITKSDLAPDFAQELKSIYQKIGYPVFCTSVTTDSEEMLASCRRFLMEQIGEGIAAFAGASGVGKSSLLRALFPTLPVEVGALSKKIDRGRQTTRLVQLFRLQDLGDGFKGYLADTPGFGVLDYVKESRLTKDNLPLAFPEFVRYLGTCRYTDCSHRVEEGCSVVEAVRTGDISRERHTSYLEMYEELKNKHPWDQA